MPPERGLPARSGALPHDLPDPAKLATGRLFFALWPDPAAAALLEEAGRQRQAICGGRSMRRETLHLTLAFLGNVAICRLDSLRQLAAAIRAPAFTLRLDRLGCWHHIVWAGCRQTPAALSDLVGQLHSSLRQAGFPIEDRPFAAHVTLLRNARCDARPEPAPSLPPIDWHAVDFVLAVSQGPASGGGYAAIGRWTLAPAID